MSFFSNRVNVLLNGFVRARIRRHYRALGGEPFSLLSNNCLAGLVYHDLGLQFDSPTINLCMPLTTFLPFVERIDEAIHAELVEMPSSGQSCPVGRLQLAPIRQTAMDGDPEPILLSFVHYRSFASAKAAWKRRAARVNLENTVILAAENATCTESDIVRFRALPFPKLLLTPFQRSADLLGSEAVLFPDLPPNAFRIADFSGLNGRRFYHRIDVAETMFRLSSVRRQNS